MLYRVSAATGYRAGELAALTPTGFVLDGSPPSIDLDGAFTKNGKPACQPIPADLAADLRGFLAARPSGRPVWPGTWSDRAAEMIQADAVAAGVPVTVDTKDGPQVLDFHSLRSSYATFLDGLDISLKARQELMRHSDPRLTMNRYTRAKLHDLGAAVEKLPPLGPSAPASEPAVLRATGTDGRCSSDAVPDAVRGGSGRLLLRTGEDNGGPPADPDPGGAGNNKPLRSQGFEESRERPGTLESGEGGIRTRGAILLARRFSKAVLSTTQPPLQRVAPAHAGRPGFVAITLPRGPRPDKNRSYTNSDRSGRILVHSFRPTLGHNSPGPVHQHPSSIPGLTIASVNGTKRFTLRPTAVDAGPAGRRVVVLFSASASGPVTG
jgi:hypothetical protein